MDPERTAAYDAALAGDLDAGRRALAITRDETSAITRCWRYALQELLRFSAEPEAGADAPPPPMPDADPEGGWAWVARAEAHRVRWAAMAFDRAGLEQAILRFERIPSGRDLEADAWRAVADAWRQVSRGADPRSTLEGAHKIGAQLQRAELVLEAIALAALGAENAGDQAGALAIARRASRMARTEGLPHSEFLANLVLARSRRLDQQPHLAARILHALRPLIAPVWRSWLELELRLALGESSEAPDPRATAGLALWRALSAARRGETPAFLALIEGATRSVEGFAPLHADLIGARSLLDPNLSLPALPSPWREWADGSVAQPPRGLIGLAGDPGPSGRAVAFVWAPGSTPARRVLSPGHRLLGAERALAPEEAGPQLRTDSAVAALLLVGPGGVGEEALFRRLYGFDYEPVRHQSVRDVLYQRVKKRIAPARLEREANQVRLIHEGPWIVPDPRSSPPAELRILRLLGARKVAAAREVAGELGIPLRTAQDALARLAEDGAVKKEKARAGLHYILEDTTFSEPTRRFRAS